MREDVDALAVLERIRRSGGLVGDDWDAEGHRARAVRATDEVLENFDALFDAQADLASHGKSLPPRSEDVTSPSFTV